MSVWWLTCQQSVFKRYHSNKYFSEFHVQNGGAKQPVEIWNKITSLSPCVCDAVKSMLLPIESLLCRLFLAIIYIHDVIHKPEVYHITTPPEEDQAVKIGENRTNSSADMVADRQSDRQTNRREGTVIIILRSPMEKSQHTDFNEDATNESTSVACSNVRLWKLDSRKESRMKKHVLTPLR